MAAEAMTLDALKATITVHDDAKALLGVSSDSGRILFRTPRAVVRPRSAQEIAQLMRWAGEAQEAVVVRGMGHTQHGQSLIEGGISLDMASLHHIGPLAGDLLEVEGGATWQSVVDYLDGSGFLPPVLTNNLASTVGGTISAGGVGTSSHVRGIQAGHVVSLQVVTGSGDILECSATHNRDLFDATRCGFGQCGVIVKARIRVQPVARHVRTFHFAYELVTDLLADQSRMLADGRFQHMRAFYAPRDRRIDATWHFRLSVGAELDGEADDRACLAGLSEPERADTHTALEWYRYEWAELINRRAGPGASFPVCEAFVPIKAAKVIPELFDQLPPVLRAACDVMFQPVLLATDNTPPLLARPDEEMVLAIGLYPVVPTAALPRILPVLEKAGNMMTQLGGKRYLTGWVRYRHEEWVEHFGAVWPKLLAWREMFDPHGCLGGGFIRYRSEK